MSVSIMNTAASNTRPGNPAKFTELADGVTYHLCDLPVHDHHIPVRFTSCYEHGAWTWESRYSWLRRKDA